MNCYIEKVPQVGVIKATTLLIHFIHKINIYIYIYSYTFVYTCSVLREILIPHLFYQNFFV